MKAWRLEAYGADGNPADAIAKLKLEESVAVPEPKAGQVQVKVRRCKLTLARKHHPDS